MKEKRFICREPELRITGEEQQHITVENGEGEEMRHHEKSAWPNMVAYLSPLPWSVC